jgi:hypothetical protein
LLIVGGADRPVLALHQAAAQELSGPSKVAVVPGTDQLFEEPETLERVAELAAKWFTLWLEPDEPV